MQQQPPIEQLIRLVVGRIPGLDPSRLRRVLAEEFLCLVIHVVLTQFPDHDPDQLRDALTEAWQQFLAGPTNEQLDEMRGVVAQILQQQLKLSPGSATRIVLEMIHEPNNPTHLMARQQAALPTEDWGRVQDAVIGIDAEYKQQAPDSATQWLRQVRVFLKDGQARIRQVTHETTVLWAALPGEVRDAKIERGEQSQRFVLFGDKSRQD